MNMRDIMTGRFTGGVSAMPLKLALISLCFASCIAERDSDRMASRLHRQLMGRRRLPEEERDAADNAREAEERRRHVWEQKEARRERAEAEKARAESRKLRLEIDKLRLEVNELLLVDGMYGDAAAAAPKPAEKREGSKGLAGELTMYDVDAAADEPEGAGGQAQVPPAGWAPLSDTQQQPLIDLAAEAKKGDWKGLAGATSGLCGVSLLTYSMSTWINGGYKVADPTAFWIPFGIGAVLLLIGVATCVMKKDFINRQRLGIATVLVFQASAISMIAFGGFEQAGNNLIHIDELGGMNVFLLIGVSVFVLTLIGMGVFYACYHKEHPRSQFAMGLGAVLTVLVGGSATTIALSPTLLTGNAMWIGIGVGAFVLVAICAAAFRTCSRYGGSGAEAMNDNKTGALVFVAWSGIIAVTGTGAAMISTSAINGQVVLYNPLFWIGAVLAGVVAVGLLAGRLCCQKKSACRNLFFQ